MSPRRRQRASSYLSSIDNTPTPTLEDLVCPKAGFETANEELSWSIIDREILEWQYMCETGRPYWWSQEAKHSRLNRLTPVAYDRSNEIDGATKPIYHERRRTVSESYLEDASNVNSLAHMIAIQLLGSCFTLPPDHASGNRYADYTTFDRYGASAVPDPRLISSLRLHSHFRYSPCFGHEPRNTSPAQLWPGIYDGPLSPALSRQNNSESGMDTDDARPTRRRMRKTLNVTENSECSLESTGGDGYMSRRNTDHAGHEAAAAACSRRHSIREAITQSFSLPQRMPTMRSSKKHHRPDPPMNTPIENEIVNALLPNRTTSGHQSSRNNRLQPVLHSEPHHVFVQPVKELVIKPWRSLRRRVGGSMHSPHCLPTVTPESRRSEASESGQSCTSISSVTPEGRARRRRAQERGDIYSSMDSKQHNTTPANGMCDDDAAHALSRPYWLDLETDSLKSKKGCDRLCGSAESTPYYNTPASGYLTPEGSTAQKPSWLDSRNPSPKFQMPDPIAAALAVPNCMSMLNGRDPGTVSTPLQPPSSPASWVMATPSSTSSTGAHTPQLSNAKSPNNGNTSTAEFQLRSMQTPPTFQYSSMRIPKRHRRTSLLSEVCTPEDFSSPNAKTDDRETVERNVRSTFGTPLATPIEENCRSPFSESCQIPNFPGAPTCVDNVVSPGATLSPGTRTKARAMRLSRSGSQIFTPDDEGVELNGLPTGPGREMWAAKGGRRERTYL